eukprot:scaffold2644_cov63-Phaeocystis_antarctica.AAC.4
MQSAAPAGPSPAIVIASIPYPCVWGVRLHTRGALVQYCTFAMARVPSACDDGSWLETKRWPGIDARVVCRAMLARHESPTRQRVEVAQARGSLTAGKLGTRFPAASAVSQVKTRLAAKLSAIHVGGHHCGPRWSPDFDVVEIGDADGLAHHNCDVEIVSSAARLDGDGDRVPHPLHGDVDGLPCTEPRPRIARIKHVHLQCRCWARGRAGPE